MTRQVTAQTSAITVRQLKEKLSGSASIDSGLSQMCGSQSDQRYAFHSIAFIAITNVTLLL